MRVSEVHPQYNEYCDDWELVYDSLREKRIKDKGVQYLRRTGGQSLHKTETDNDDPYQGYKHRARFPQIVAPAVTSLTGIAHRLPYTLEAPERFIKLTEEITANQEPLDELSRKTVRHTLLDGRYGLLSDVDDKGNPSISVYSASTILDWHCEVVAGRKVVTYVKLKEQVDKATEYYLREYVYQYRVLRLVDGFYQVEIYDDSDVQIGETIEPRKSSGERLDYIPFVFVGSIDLTPDCDESPLQPLARIAVSIYNLDADYRQSLHMTSQPTPVISTSASSDDLPTSIGCETLWVLPENSKAEYLEFTGAGIEAQRKEINDEYERAAKTGGELGHDTSQAESGEALRVRMFSRHASLFSVAKTAGAGIEIALRSCADFISIDPNLITFTPNLDFTGAEIKEALINVLNNAVMSGNIPRSVLFNALRDGGYTDKTDEELEDEIELGAMPAPEVDES